MNKELVAIAYTSLGVRKEFECDINDTIWCRNEDLVMLDIPEGVKKVYCVNNSLTLLKVPDSVEYLYCEMNNIVELVISENSLLKRLWCDKRVKGLEKIIGHEKKLIRLL